MAWFECHQTMARHPKTLRLARLLKVDRRYAVGLLVDLFSWGLDVAGSDGTLPGVCAEDIAAALDIPGKKGETAVAALREVRFLELEGDTWKIHDWTEYAGKLIEKRAKDRARKNGGS